MGRLTKISSAVVLPLIICCVLDARVLAWEPIPKPVDQLPAGIRFGNEPPKDWSNLILFAVGRLASGDLEVVTNTVARYAKLFNIVILANAEQDAAGEYFLEKVCFGFSMVIGGQNTVVTPDTQKQLGARLGFIGRGVLSGNHSALQDILQVARSRTTVIVDAPTIMLDDGEHREMICRMAIWVAPATGKIGTAVWLLNDDGRSSNDYRIVEDVFQYLPENMREDRIMNVDADRFTLGIPAQDAFAVVRIPQGKPFGFTDEMRALAGARRFDAQKYQALWSSMAAAMAQPNLTAKASTP